MGKDAMTRLEKLLSQYAAYHLDKRNVATHFVGIPLIVFSIICLTAKADFIISGYSVTFALILMVLSTLYYLSLDLFFGLLIGILFVLVYPLAIRIADMSITYWLVGSILIFIVGWIFQFIGHFYEKKKPAFTDDIIGLIIGPLFVMAEFIFAIGLRKELQRTVFMEAQKLRLEMDHSSANVESS